MRRPSRLRAAFSTSLLSATTASTGTAHSVLRSSTPITSPHQSTTCCTSSSSSLMRGDYRLLPPQVYTMAIRLASTAAMKGPLEVALTKMKSLGALTALAGLWKTSDLNTASQGELPDPKMVGLSMLLMSLPKDTRAELSAALPELLQTAATAYDVTTPLSVDASAKFAPSVALLLLVICGGGVSEEGGVQASLGIHTKGLSAATATKSVVQGTSTTAHITKDMIANWVAGKDLDKVVIHWCRVVGSSQQQQAAAALVTEAAPTKVEQVVTEPVLTTPSTTSSQQPASSTGGLTTSSTTTPSLDSIPKVPAVVLWRLIEHAVSEAPKLDQVQAVYSKILSIDLDVDRWVAADANSKNVVSLRHLIRKQYSRVVEVLNKCKPFGCHISKNGTLCTKARPDDIRKLTYDLLDDATKAQYADAPAALQQEVLSALAYLKGTGWSGFTESEVERLLDPPKTAEESHASSAQENSNLWASATPGWEFEDLRAFYQPTLTRDPPPPPDDAIDSAGTSFRQSHMRQAVRDGLSEFSGVFSAQMLVPLIPTFFVPVQVMVKQLPEGYTEDHVHTLFKQTSTVEIIQLGEKKEHFIRLHGGNRAVDMIRVSGQGNSHYANNLPAYSRFRPDPSLCEHFTNVLKKAGVRMGQWVSLRHLLMDYAKPEYVEALPYHKFLSLLYFAQMQHKFQFSIDEGGQICMIDPHRSNLSPETSPTPVVINEILGILLTHKEVSIDTLISTAETGAAGDLDESIAKFGNASGGEDIDLVTSLQGLSAYSRDLILEYFDGSLLKCLQSHHNIFYIDMQKMTVCNHNHRRNQILKSKSLDEQLQDAITHRDKTRIKKLRRKIMKQINPDNPLFDPTRMAEEIARFLPEKQPISLRMLMRNLPHEVSNCFPSSVMSVFRNHPKLFKIFEYREAHKLYVQRPEIPLPDGYLKMTYTEAELIHLIAGILQSSNNGTTRTLYDVYGKLPYFAQELVRTVYKNIFDVVKKYPQYFTVVFKESVRMDIRVATCSLLALPPHVDIEAGIAEPGCQKKKPYQHKHKQYGSGGGGSSENDDAELQAALESLRANISKAGYKESTGKDNDDDFDFTI